jgi:hypothetical protein
MKTGLMAVLLGTALSLVAFQALPRCTAVDPDTGKTGDMISAKGENLGKTYMSEMYLTDGQKDTKVTIDRQSDGEVQFKVPTIKPGRYRLAILTANKASMIEQPVVLTVE